MLDAGTRLGPYEIDALIGAGGMGEVYRARDTRLGRAVALKVLPSDFALDFDRRTRFEREARAISRLEHPHICALYDVGEQSGTHYFVMPHLDGETLAARIRKRPLPPDQALRYAIEIADALDLAHRHGIVHRDLKPGNVMVTRSGAQLLDFGLAKLRGAAAPFTLSDLTELGHVDTATARGVILGTIPYMSPEQIEGREADARSDIWAFGAVLYEMLTGRRAFPGDTPASVIGAVMRDDPPPVSTAQPLAPAALDFVVRTCLARDPDERWQSAADLKRQLRWIAETLRAPAETPSASNAWSARLSRGVPWAVAFAAIAFAGAAYSLRSGPPAPSAVGLSLNVPDDLEMYSLTGSPLGMSANGTFLAFTANNKAIRRMVFLRRMDQTDVQEVRGTELATSLFFWPDESALGVTASDGTLRKITLKDGLVVTLAGKVDYNSGATAGADGSVVYVRDRTLWQLPAGGGDPRRLTALDEAGHESAHQWPLLLPGDHVVLFTSFRADDDAKPRIEALNLADGKRHTVVSDGVFPMYASAGALVFLRGDALLAAAFDARSLKLTGDPVRVVDKVAVTSSGAPVVTMSTTGALVYASADSTAGRLVSVSRDGAETPIESVPRSYSAPRLSPDGRRLVVAADGSRLWLQDRARSFFQPLSPPEPNAGWPVWMPDNRVLYRSLTGIRWIETDGSGRSGTIAGTSQQDIPCSVSPDGSVLAFLRVSPATTGDIYTLSLRGDPNPQPLANSAAFEGGPRFSPDGRWIAYVSNESTQYQVYMRPFPGPDRKIQVSTEGGTFPVWSRTGDELFYRSGHKLMAVKVSNARASDPVLSPPRTLFERKYRFTGNTIAGYEVSPDAQSFVFVKPEPTANELNVVVNWFGELQRRLGLR